MNIFYTLLKPRAVSEDTQRQEFILQVLLLGSLSLFGIAIMMSFVALASRPESYGNNALSIGVLAIAVACCIGLFVLSRRGHSRLASYAVLAIFFVLIGYIGFRWGIDVPAQLVFYPLLIVMAGILISTRFAFVTTGLIALTITMTGYLQMTGRIPVNQYWKGELWTGTDVIMIIVIYAVIATVSWLSNREIEKSLIRARRSEAALKEERDNLEIRVTERTEELRKAELERMSQAYKFVEFGRLAGSIFHDLASPLTALSLNLDSIAQGAGDQTKLARIAGDIDRAKSATAHMQKLMGSMRKHLAREGECERFSLHGALTEAVHVLSSYARGRNVSLRYLGGAEARLYGDPVAFMQIVTNIVSNAIESFPARSGSRTNRLVTITVQNEEDGALLTIKDTGSGMSPETLERVFEPFFSTKAETGGLGIGLSLAKRVLEKDFDGTFEATSALGEGTAFALYFPQREP